MSLFTLIGVLLVIGLVLWGVNQAPFIDAGWKKAIYVIVCVIVGLWVLSIIFPGVMNIHVPVAR